MSIEGRWYVTKKAAQDYAAIFELPTDEAGLVQARLDLIECSKTAHFVRRERDGIMLWRTGKEWYRMGLVVGEAPSNVAGSLPALIGVLRPHAGWKLSDA